MRPSLGLVTAAAILLGACGTTISPSPSPSSGTSPSPGTSPRPASWSVTGSLVEPRFNHTATLLANGTVLAVGGWNLTSAEIYDPHLGTWRATGSMSTARDLHTATRLLDGRVLVVGGYGPGGVFATAEVYEPATGVWTPAGSMSTVRRDHTATLLQDGRVLVVGGDVNGSGNLLASAEIFDASTGMWSPTGSLKEARSQHTATMLTDGSVLVAGGGQNGPGPISASAERYDPKTGAWTSAGTMATKREDGTATLLADGRVLVAGGYGPAPSFAASAELYDPASGTWTAAGAMMVGRGSHTATLLADGRVLVVGGIGPGFATPKETELYNPGSGRWTGAGPLPARPAAHAAVLLLDGRVLVTGGISSERSAELYDPGTEPADETVDPGPKAPAPPSPPNRGAVLTDRVLTFSDRVEAAARAIPREVPRPRQADESFAAYAIRAQAAARSGAGGIRDLLEGERQSLASVDAYGCPATDRFRILVDAYRVVAAAIWAALYAPDAALLRQGLTDLDALNASLATAKAELSTAPDACAITLESGVAALASRVVGTQSVDILRSRDLPHESAIGDLVTDAMRWKYPDVEVALVNSGGLRADLLVRPPSAGEQSGEITWGELIGVLPFGDRAVIVTVSGDHLVAALRNGFAPACDPAFEGGSGRFPQLSGLEARFHCDGTTPVVDGVWRVPDGAARSDVISPDAAIRLATVDYLVAGGDGYSLSGSDTREPGDTLLSVTMDYLGANSPVAPAAERRVIGP